MQGKKLFTKKYLQHLRMVTRKWNLLVVELSQEQGKGFSSASSDNYTKTASGIYPNNLDIRQTTQKNSVF